MLTFDVTHHILPPAVDARRSPRCAEPGCRKACQHLADGEYTAHCWRHATPEERQAFSRAHNLEAGPCIAS